MARLDPGETGLVDAEDRSDIGEIAMLGLMHRAVGGGDQEQAVEHVLQQGRLVVEMLRELRGIGLEAGAGLLGEIEQPFDLGLLAGRNLDDPPEGGDLVTRHHTIGARHLGGERDEPGGEDDLLRRRAEGRAFAVHQHMAGQRADERAERAAQHEANAAAAQGSP